MTLTLGLDLLGRLPPDLLDPCLTLGQGGGGLPLDPLDPQLPPDQGRFVLGDDRIALGDDRLEQGRVVGKFQNRRVVHDAMDVSRPPGGRKWITCG